MPAYADEVAIHARRRAPRVFFARMGRPNPNTSWPDPCDWPGYWYWWLQHDVFVMSSCTVGMLWMTSAWCKHDVSMHNWHAMSAKWDPHAMSSAASRSDWILAVWNTIWMISDLFLANLIVPDAMVWSDCWDWDQKLWWWIIERDCPMMRHLKVMMVVDGDEEEDVTHVCPIMCVELLSEEILIALREGKIGTL